MSHGSASIRLWLIIDGPSGDARVIAASQRAPRRGRRVEVVASASVLQTRSIWLLVRKEPADVVLAVDSAPEPLEVRRQQLGQLAAQYQVIQVPLVDRSPAD